MSFSSTSLFVQWSEAKIPQYLNIQSNSVWLVCVGTIWTMPIVLFNKKVYWNGILKVKLKVNYSNHVDFPAEKFSKRYKVGWLFTHACLAKTLG